MYVRIQQTVAPVGQLITPELARQHTRIDLDADTNLLILYIDSATRIIEKYLNQALLPQTLLMTYAETRPPTDWPMTTVPFPILPLFLQWTMNGMQDQSIQLFYGPAQSVVSVSENNWDGTANALTLAVDYDVDVALDPPRIRMHSGLFQSLSVANYQIVYTAGLPPAQIPSPISHACLMVTAKMWESRGDVDEGEMLSRNVRSLLDQYRLPVFG